MRHFKHELLMSLILAASLAGCTAHSGDEYVGEWVYVKDASIGMKIERNGDAFILRSTEPDRISGWYRSTENKPAVLKDGVLQWSNGMGMVDMIIDQKTGHLLEGSREYQRGKIGPPPTPPTPPTQPK